MRLGSLAAGRWEPFADDGAGFTWAEQINVDEADVVKRRSVPDSGTPALHGG